MQKRLHGRVVAGLAACAATLWLAAGLQAKPRQPVASPQCTITLTPESVTVAMEPVEVQARYTTSVGDSISVNVPGESGIQVVSATKGDDDSATITFDTSSGQAGEWPLTLTGESGECRGTINVVGTGPTQR